MKLIIEKNNDNVLISTAILENGEAFNDNQVVSYLLISCIKFCREIGLSEKQIDETMVMTNLNYHKHYKE